MKKILLCVTSLFFLSAMQSYAIYDSNAQEIDCPEEMCIMTLSLPAPIMYQTYTTQEDFENSEGHICESATDGVNTFMMKDGDVFAGTKMGYPDDYVAEWKCNSYISDTIIAWSQSDKNEYNTLIERTTELQKQKVQSVQAKFDTIYKKYSERNQDILIDLFLEMIDTHIGEIILAYPQDVALPDNAYAIYQMLKYLRYEIIVNY